MLKILCPTDFSKAAMNAIDFAAIIAEKSMASLTLLHVLHLPMLDTTDTALVAAETMGEHKRQVTDKINALCRHLTEKYRSSNLKVDYIVKEALLGDVIQQLTQTAGFDMVVVGSTGGDNTLEEILIGSNTLSIIENVKCPVLSVPVKAEPKHFEHIVYASDYQEKDAVALKHILQFANLFGASVEIVHMSTEIDNDNESKANRFREMLRQALPDFNLEFREVIHPNEVEGMKDYLTQKDADLLAILKVRRSFFSNLFSQSFSEQLTYQSKLPLLVFHE